MGLLKISVIFVAVFGVLFQVFLKERVVRLFAIGRDIQPISDFPWECRRIDRPRLQACEDIWLSEATRQMFFACSDPVSRHQWLPAIMKMNWEKRSLVDTIIVADLEKPEDGFYATRVLSTEDYVGAPGDDGRLYLHGLEGIETTSKDGETRITLAVINHLPSIDPVTGKAADQAVVGGNSTVEIFETGPNATVLKHIRTIAHPGITVPNRATFAGDHVDDGIYVTNESKQKTGLMASLSKFAPLGNTQFCDASGCEEVSSHLSFPNGLHRARDGLLYVPSSGDGTIRVYRPVVGASGADGKPKHALEEVGFMDIGCAIDNISEDADGNLFVAAFPKTMEIIDYKSDPRTTWSTGLVYRIQQTPGAGGKLAFAVEKVIEDRDKKVLPGATTAIRDAKTGRLFLGGVTSPFITVCDPK